MWKKLYSNSGLILLAVLAGGVWFSNIHSLFQPENTPKNTDFDALTTPTPRKSAEEILGITHTPLARRKYADIEEVLRTVPSPSPALPAVDPKESEKKTTALERELADIKEAMKQRRLTATAVCRDGTYSYSRNRRGTCSHHGGVAQWLSR